MVSMMTQEGGDGCLHGVPSLKDMMEFEPRAHVSMAFLGEGLEVGKESGQKCPRCDSSHTKFCYYNNYSLSQPRYFCRSCKRYWTEGGTLRNIPVGGGCRKKQKKKKKNADDNGPCITGSTFGITPQSHSMVPFFPCAASELFSSCGPASFLGILNSGKVDHADETPLKFRMPPTTKLTELPIMADLPTIFENQEVFNSVQDTIPDTEDEDYTLVGNSTKFFSSSFEWCRQQVPSENTTTTTTNNNKNNQVSLKRSMMLMMMEDGSMTDEELEKRVGPSIPNEEIAMPEWQVPPISSSYEDFFEESW